jgi:hypothetical protein
MRQSEALTTMTSDIYNAVQHATKRVLDFITANVQPGESVLLIGVGNTVGVGQPPAGA